MKTNNVLMVIGPQGFQDMEYLEPKKVFEENGFNVVTCSKGVQVAVGQFGFQAMVNVDIVDVDVNNYDAIVFVGGGGALVYEENEAAMELIKSAYELGKIVTAICIGPRILANAGVLKGKKITMWNGDGEQKDFVESKDAIFTGTDVEEDGRIITGNGPAVAKEFGLKVVAKLKS